MLSFSITLYIYLMRNDIQQFKASLRENACPVGLNIYLQALWFDGKGDWQKAHDLVNDLDSTEGARVHAYLHRKEGDIGNADYWYRRAGATRPVIPLDDEWLKLVEYFLDHKP